MAKRVAFLFLLLWILHVSADVLGVLPSKNDLYIPKNGKFQCLDHSKEISFSEVNDDYCDCPDGSDEPGTSACPLGRFTCHNVGYRPIVIPSSRVNDGICDCCDGSDEYRSGIPCKNDCYEKGAIAKKAAQERLRGKIQGWEAKKIMIAEGLEAKAERERKIEELKQNMEVLEKELEEIRQKKEEAEALEKEYLDIQRKKQEELEAQNIDQDVGKFCSEFTQKFESIISQLDKLKTRLQEYQNKLDSGEKISLFDLVTDIEEVKAQIPTTPGFCTSKIQPTAKIVVDENQHVYEEEDLYMDDDDLHYSAEMTEDEEKEMFDSSEQNVEEKKEEKEEKEEEENDSPTKMGKDDSLVDIFSNIVQKCVDYLNIRSLFDSTESVADTARELFEKKEKEVGKLKSEISELEKINGFNFGPDQELFSLYKRCFTFENQEYTYEFCPFDRVDQKPKSGSSTGLGTYQQWTRDPTGFVMKFDNGMRCWNGPNRSTHVSFICGDSHRLISVDEPAKCEYKMEFVTPAVCEEPPNVEQSNTEPVIHDEL